MASFASAFRYAGKQYKKSLRTRDPAAAQAACHLVELTIYRLTTGQLYLPQQVDVGDFIVSGGTRTKTSRMIALSLEGLIEQYLASRISVADSTRRTERIHLGHFKKFLGSQIHRPCSQVSARDLQRYLTARASQCASVTLEKERATLVQLFQWAKTQGYLQDVPTTGLPRVQGASDRRAFRTMDQIARLVERGGLSEKMLRELWECLYLSTVEIARLLQLVKQRSGLGLGYLLHALPAYTGMRRGEILRCRWEDVDLESGVITACSRKQSRQQQDTTRQIDLHPELASVLATWKTKRTKGQFVISDAATLQPLTVDQANQYFWKPMRKTEWCLNGSRNWFKVGFHTYRHSFASNLAAAGVDQRIIDEWMGHQTEAMRKRYRHLFPNKRREAINSFSLMPAS